ncbi:hypothetical protein BMT54_02990 [Pasteurellaceae bacterium 15-036681]|nr:hypothetical protein BMT54_02990 [Pasteurellaceae bacterium 15-036681]
MKKSVISALVLALSIAGVAEAKRGSSFKPSRSSTPIVQKKQPTQQAQQQQQAKQGEQHRVDADFYNTPRAATNNAAAQQAAGGSRMNSLLTGAAAGYLLSNALAPSEAQAQTANPAAEATAEPMAQLTQQVQQAAPAIQTFKSIDPQDPYLIEKSAGYLRYCLNGVQYLISTANTQLPPTVMVDRNNAPVACVISQ